MAKKRVTLPKEFKDLMDEGNIEALKAVYDRCELTAHDGRFSLCTPLHMGGVPDELVIWLVEKGLSISLIIMERLLCIVRQPWEEIL